MNVKKSRKAKRRPLAKRTQTTKNPAPKKNGIIFQAVPNDRKVTAIVTPQGEPSVIFPGRVLLTDEMKERLTDRCSAFWHPGGKEQRTQKFDWIVNTLADPDRYSNALTYLNDQLANHPLPVFNNPSCILETARDVVWRKLSDVSNLIAPRCVRFLATHPDHFRDAFERGNFEYPVLVRPAGTHTGDNLILIDSDRNWDRIHKIAWGGREIYLTQWVDFRSENGDWRKLRLAITPEGIHLRHILFGSSWLIHAVERSDVEVERELEILMNAEEWQALQKLGADIRQRVGLDFFGVDLGWKSDTEFVLFEANASMSILSYRNVPTYRRHDYVASLRRIEDDVWRTLSRFSGPLRSKNE